MKIFKTQIEAVAFLIDYGYKVGKSKFSDDFRMNRIATTEDGYFDENGLLGYAGRTSRP